GSGRQGESMDMQYMLNPMNPGLTLTPQILSRIKAAFVKQEREGRPPLKLVGKSANAQTILGMAENAARRAGWSLDEIREFKIAATAGDYNKLLAVTLENFDVS
ncbi:MAG TPA: hypothetical protein VFV92_07050, partial [Candidatus Bathyarchaeia archaeon]|nr:hypothetical protein [Candidatus Bathyarchaeia archaeon]